MILVVNTMMYLLQLVDSMIQINSLLLENVVHVEGEAPATTLKEVNYLLGLNQKILRGVEPVKEDGTNQWDLFRPRSETL